MYIGIKQNDKTYTHKSLVKILTFALAPAHTHTRARETQSYTAPRVNIKQSRERARLPAAVIPGARETGFPKAECLGDKRGSSLTCSRCC